VSRVESFTPETAEYALQTSNLPECLRSLTELSPGAPPEVVLPSELSSELLPATAPAPSAPSAPSWENWMQSADAVVRSTRRLMTALEAQREWSQCVAHAETGATANPHTTPSMAPSVGPSVPDVPVTPSEPTARLANDQFAWILAVVLVTPLPVVFLLLVLLRRQSRLALKTTPPEPTWAPVTGEGSATPTPSGEGQAEKRFELGPTYAEQREAEQQAAEQQERALLQQIFEENRKLQQQLAQPESTQPRV
jgi:hypothetical protein